MEPQEYPLHHFQLMVKLADELRTLPAQILEHAYHYGSFGSWWTTLQRRGIAFRIVFDGKDRQLRLERATTPGSLDSWEVVSTWLAGDHDGAHAIPDVVARLRAV